MNQIPLSAHFVMVWVKQDIPTARTSQSSIAGQMGITTDCPNWLPNWFAARLP
jgi:hypothetical protein